MLWKIAASYTMGFMLTNVAFSLSSAPFVETIKSSEPITTAPTLLNNLPLSLSLSLSVSVSVSGDSPRSPCIKD